MRKMAAFAAGLLGLASLASAQTLPIEPNIPTDQVKSQGEGLKETGRTAGTGVGEIGQRQTRSDVAPSIQPMARTDTRIRNRVQNRLMNRIDRNFDPTQSANLQVEQADERARRTGRTKPRR